MEGYEPYGAGVKQSQNNFCNENRAMVSTLDFRSRHVNVKSFMSLGLGNLTPPASPQKKHKTFLKRKTDLQFKSTYFHLTYSKLPNNKETIQNHLTLFS